MQQISFSGLGVKAGSPIGGRDQKGKYKVGCRWNGKRIRERIRNVSDMCKRKSILGCYNLDFGEVMKDCNGFMYIDPPYYKQGNNLYKEGFSIGDHERLMGILKSSSNKWLLSYDDCEEVREMYKWARIEEVGIKYSINSIKENEKKELMIML